MKRVIQKLLKLSPLLLLLAIAIFFASRSSKFLEPPNLANIAAQSASTGIVTIGMTFVLLTAGVDLSVGSMMFLSAAIAGKMALVGIPVYLVIPAMLFAGLLFGMANVLFITKTRVVPFIVTLATLFIGRGISLWITKTRAMNLPEIYLDIGSAQFLGIPFPAWLFASLLLLGHFTVTRTPFGRQILALGHDAEAARKAGIRTGAILSAVYLISALCASVAAIVSLGQLGAVSPKFGEQKEFAAIAAAVLGGTSLFGGRGTILPGALIGTVIIQTIQNGLVIINADPYVYPMATSAIIFLAISFEGFRQALAERSRGFRR